VNESFCKSERLLRRAEYRRLSEMGRKIHVPHFLILYLPTDHRRLGITVSSRIGPAVVRNRIKRLVREVYRTRKEMFSSCEFNVIAKRGAGLLSRDDVERELRQALERTGT
jgi:ribonuclease P protein component